MVLSIYHRRIREERTRLALGASVIRVIMSICPVEHLQNDPGMLRRVGKEKIRLTSFHKPFHDYILLHAQIMDLRLLAIGRTLG